MNIPVSACIITLNEEENIERCIASVKWTDEVLVVDSGSSDRTVQIAENMGARVIHNDWPGFIKQKQLANDRAKNDWILNLDADEEVSEELKKNIIKFFEENPDPQTACEVNRLSWYLGRWVFHGSFYPDYVCRLFNRNTFHWGGYEPHAHPEGNGTVKQISGHLYHYPYKNLSDHINFINGYTSTMAQEKSKKGVEGTAIKPLAHSFVKFIKDYFLKKGFLDGGAGLIIAVTGAFYSFIKYAKLWEIQKVKKEVPDEKP